MSFRNLQKIYITKLVWNIFNGEKFKKIKTNILIK